MSPRTMCTSLICLLFASVCPGQQDLQETVSPKALEQLNQTVAGYVKDGSALGAELLVIHRDQVLTQRSFGLKDLENENSWENNTLCNIRSMTKPITSAAAQILIDRGKLELDKPVSAYLDSFDNDESREITVRQVLTHRSGLPLTNVLNPYQYESLREQAGKMGETGPSHEPGSRFWYSDIGTDVVGAVVEQVAGEKLDQFVEREIFVPLKMADTLYGIDPDDERLKLAANGYFKGTNKWFPFWKSGSKPLYPFAWGSQTVYSTTTDYAKFMNLLKQKGKVGDRQILSPAAVERMLTPVSRLSMMGSERPMPTGFLDLQPWYGQMMVVYCKLEGEMPDGSKRVVVFGHSGSDGTAAWVWPDRDLVILYFTQSRGGASALQIERAIDKLIVRPDQQVSVKGVPEEFHPYIGLYSKQEESDDKSSDSVGEAATVTFSNGSLIIDVPGELPFELLPVDEDGFWKFAIAPDRMKLRFSLDDQGQVTGAQLYRGDKEIKLSKQE